MPFGAIPFRVLEALDIKVACLSLETRPCDGRAIPNMTFLLAEFTCSGPSWQRQVNDQLLRESAKFN